MNPFRSRIPAEQPVNEPGPKARACMALNGMGIKDADFGVEYTGDELRIMLHRIKWEDMPRYRAGLDALGVKTRLGAYDW